MPDFHVFIIQREICTATLFWGQVGTSDLGIDGCCHGSQLSTILCWMAYSFLYDWYVSAFLTASHQPCFSSSVMFWLYENVCLCFCACTCNRLVTGTSSMQPYRRKPAQWPVCWFQSPTKEQWLVYGSLEEGVWTQTVSLKWQRWVDHRR